MYKIRFDNELETYCTFEEALERFAEITEQAADHAINWCQLHDTTGYPVYTYKAI